MLEAMESDASPKSLELYPSTSCLDFVKAYSNYLKLHLSKFAEIYTCYSNLVTNIT